jgi:hypothetical protein
MKNVIPAQAGNSQILLVCANLQPLRVLVVVFGDYRLRGNDSKLLKRSALCLRWNDGIFYNLTILRLRLNGQGL